MTTIALLSLPCYPTSSACAATLSYHVLLSLILPFHLFSPLYHHHPLYHSKSNNNAQDAFSITRCSLLLIIALYCSLLSSCIRLTACKRAETWNFTLSQYCYGNLYNHRVHIQLHVKVYGHFLLNTVTINHPIHSKLGRNIACILLEYWISLY